MCGGGGEGANPSMGIGARGFDKREGATNEPSVDTVDTHFQIFKYIYFKIQIHGHK